MHVGKPTLQRRWTPQMHGRRDWLRIAATGADVIYHDHYQNASYALVHLPVFSFFLQVFLGET